MKFTKNQLKEKRVLQYFELAINDNVWKEYFDFSERGIKPKKILIGAMPKEFNGYLRFLNWFGLYPKPDDQYQDSPEFERVKQMKTWRDAHLKMWTEGVIEGSIPLYTLLGGEDKKEIPPREIVDWMKKAMFKGQKSELIENLYRQVLTP